MKQILISLFLLVFSLPNYLVAQNDYVLKYMVDNTDFIVLGQVLSKYCDASEAGLVHTCLYNIRVDSVIKGSLELQPIKFKVDSVRNVLQPMYFYTIDCLLDSVRNDPSILEDSLLKGEKRIGVTRTLVGPWKKIKSSPLYKSPYEVNQDCERLSECNYYIFFLKGSSHLRTIGPETYKYELISNYFGAQQANPLLIEEIHQYIEK